MTHLGDKFTVTRTDGTPVGPGAEFLVLRLDGENRAAERWAARAFAIMTPDPELRQEICERITALDRKNPEPGFKFAEALDDYPRRG